MDQDLGRKFLHDFASPLSVAKLLLKKVIVEVGTLDGEQKILDKVQERLHKIETALTKIEELHASFKSEIHGSGSEKKAA